LATFHDISERQWANAGCSRSEILVLRLPKRRPPKKQGLCRGDARPSSKRVSVRASLSDRSRSGPSIPLGAAGRALAPLYAISENAVGEHRVLALRGLGAPSTDEDRRRSLRVLPRRLARHPRDIPFARLYLIDPDQERAYLMGVAGRHQHHA